MGSAHRSGAARRGSSGPAVRRGCGRSRGTPAVAGQALDRRRLEAPRSGARECTRLLMDAAQLRQVDASGLGGERGARGLVERLPEVEDVRLTEGVVLLDYLIDRLLHFR